MSKEIEELREIIRNDINELKGAKYNSFQIGLNIASWPLMFIPMLIGVMLQTEKTKLYNRIIDNYEKLTNSIEEKIKNETKEKITNASEEMLFKNLRDKFENSQTFYEYIIPYLDIEQINILKKMYAEKKENAEQQYNDYFENMENQKNNLINEIQELKKQYQNEINEHESIKQEILNEIYILKKQKESYEKQHANDIIKLENEKNELLKEIETLNSNTLSYSFDFEEFNNITSENIRNKLLISRTNEKESLQNNELISISNKTKNNNKYLRSKLKQIARSFNSECENTLIKLSKRNLEASRNKIIKTFTGLNQNFKIDGLRIKDRWLEIKLEQLNMLYSYEIKKEQEKELQKEIKEKMLEEEKVRREIELRKKKLEKDQIQCKNEINKLINYLQKTQNNAEKELYLNKIKELEEKIKELEAEKAVVLEREANAQAGYVYIISNIGSFGEDVFKIGMTRRLEPMDRIKELSSASVPFEFDVHAMIFSDNAPELENLLHQTFKEKSVNQVNFRKEFFKVSLDEIEEVVKAKYNNTVEFTKIPAASEFRQTLEILKNTTFEIPSSIEVSNYA